MRGRAWSGAAVQAAESLADLVGRLTRRAEVLPAELAGAGLPPAHLQSAAEALREAAGRWATLAPGETWVLEWRR